MKKLATAIAITAVLAAAATHQYLLGYTTFTEYLEVTKNAISGRTKFLAARIDRNYVHVEHINRSALGIKSDATIILNYPHAGGSLETYSLGGSY